MGLLAKTTDRLRAWAGGSTALATRAGTAAWQQAEGWTIVRGESPSDFERNGRAVRMTGFERHPVVHACARSIIDVLSSVDLEVYRLLTGGDVDVLENHAALAVLNAPRGAMSAQTLRARTGLHFLLYGNAFWLLERMGRQGRPTTIRSVHPEWIVQLVVDDTFDQVLGYLWRDRFGVIHSTPAEDMIHFADLTADEAGYWGFPRAASALLDITGDQEASQYVREVVTNHGTPGLVVLTEGMTSLDELRKAEDQWHLRMTERGERGRTRFVSAVKDVKPIGFDLSSLEFPDLRRISREDICAAFGVDPRIVGISSASNDGGLSGVQYREAREKLIQQTVRPLGRALTSQLDVWFMSEWGEARVRFSPEGFNALVEDPDATSKRMIEETQARIRTREEARRALGLPDDMAPEEIIVGDQDEYLAGDALERGEKQDPPALPSGTQPPPQPADEADDEDTVSRETAQRALPVVRPPKVLARGMVLVPEQRSVLWGTFDTRARKLEAPFHEAALDLFASEARSVLATLRARRSVRAAPQDEGDPYIAAAMQRIAENFAPGGQYHQAWLNRYLGLIETATTLGAADLAASLGVSFTLQNPRVSAAIRNRATELADLITEETARQIVEAQVIAREAGMTVKQLARLIEETVYAEPMTRVRAERIANTETVGAVNAGEYMAAAESGVALSKEWLTRQDAKVRETHADQDGVRVSITQAFPNGLQYPGARPAPASEVINCRCTVLYYDEEAPPAGRSSVERIAETLARRQERLTFNVSSPASRPTGRRRVAFTRNGRGELVGAELTILPEENTHNGSQH